MALADHPLKACDGVLDILWHLRQRRLAHQHLRVREGHHCRRGPQSVVVGDDLWPILMPNAHIAVRAAEIYTHSNGHD